MSINETNNQEIKKNNKTNNEENNVKIEKIENNQNMKNNENELWINSPYIFDKRSLLEIWPEENIIMKKKLIQ